ncbi:MAG: ATP-binding cassette subfamily B multidrug efflux pump [Acidimicrobiales bacterium]|jgi:ATP-binding cassette subfamily B multidrug efflux pump
MRPYWRYAAGAFVAMIISVLINLSIPLLTSRIIDDGIAEDDGSFVLRLALTMIGLIVAGMAASAVASLMGVRLAFNTITDLRRDVYAKTQTFSFGNLDELTSGEILTRLSSDMTKVTMLLSMGLSFIAQIPIMFIGALGAIVLIDASLVVIVLVMIPVIGVLVGYTISQSNVLYDAVQRRIDRLNTVLQENIQGAEVIKAFVRQEHETERFNEVADDLADQATKVNQLVASLFPTLIVISAMGISAVLWLGGGNVIEGTLTDGQLVAFISYMALVSMPMMMFAFLQPMISAASASMARINEILETVPAISFVADGINLADQPTPGDIEFDNVSFGYSSRDASSDAVMALHNVSVKIKAGTTVAILGATGSGKSTLVHLIPRLYDTSGGTVRVGGIDVRALTKSSLRRNIGIALQQPELFSGSVADNLRFGRPDATDEQIIAAATAAQAHDFITAMTNGYDSVIQQSGANLSGGQRQRLAIARTLVLEPAILLLDDSTSAVDLETEAHIQTAFEELDGTTVVLVAQRISTALGADEIIVLDEGRIVAHGSHDQLLATSAIYQDIYRSQLGEPADLGQSS